MNWRTIGQYHTCLIYPNYWKRSSRFGSRHISTAMDWCQRCSPHTDISTALRQRWRRCSMTCWLRRMLYRCQLDVCSTSLLPSILLITSYYYACLSNSSVYVASCWSGSDHICPAEHSVTFLVAVHRLLSTSSALPQGSVLGPLLFSVYTADLADIAEKHGVSLHAFADNTQLYLHCCCTDTTSAAAQLEWCIAEVTHWMSANRLKFNIDKTELLWLGSRHCFFQLGGCLPAV